MYKSSGDSTKIVKGVSVSKPSLKGGRAVTEVLGGHKIKGVKINPHMTTGHAGVKTKVRSK